MFKSLLQKNPTKNNANSCCCAGLPQRRVVIYGNRPLNIFTSSVLQKAKFTLSVSIGRSNLTKWNKCGQSVGGAERCGNSCGSEMLSERAARGSVNRPAETVRGSDPECPPWFIHDEKFDKGRIYTKRKLAHGAIFFKSN